MECHQIGCIDTSYRSLFLRRARLQTAWRPIDYTEGTDANNGLQEFISDNITANSVRVCFVPRKFFHVLKHAQTVSDTRADKDPFLPALRRITMAILRAKFLEHSDPLNVSQVRSSFARKTFPRELACDSAVKRSESSPRTGYPTS